MKKNTHTQTRAINMSGKYLIKPCLVTKHFPLWTPCLIVLNSIMLHGLWCLMQFQGRHSSDQALISRKTIVPLDGDQTCLVPFGHSVKHQHVGSIENISLRLVSKHFPFRRGLIVLKFAPETAFAVTIYIRAFTINHNSTHLRLLI